MSNTEEPTPVADPDADSNPLLQIFPTTKFKDTASPPPLDYTKKEAWAARPGVASLADFVLDGEASVPDAERLVDCFYVHPTGFFGADFFNCPVPHAQADEATKYWMLPTQAAVFNSVCRVWAPEYRQATYASYFLEADEGRAALNFAYDDVVTAFQQFLVEIGPDKPFVLASHSQGGHHLVRLLEEHVDCTPSVWKRTIAVYMPGSRVPLDKFSRSYKNLRECTGPTDHTGVVIGWDTNSDEGAIDDSATGNWYKTGWEAVLSATPTLNTNPITWSKSGVGGPITEGYLGGLTFETNVQRQLSLAEFVSPIPSGITGITTSTKGPPVTVKGCAFHVESKTNKLSVPELKRESLGILGLVETGGSYHTSDFSLFFFNIRENVRARVEAYLQGVKTEHASAKV